MSNIFLSEPKEEKAIVESKKSEATTLIQSAMLIAKKFERDHSKAFTNIIESCKRYTLAKQSMYSYPKGGQVVTGPSIRLAEVIASQWGNIRYGFNEIDQSNGSSTIEAFCHDLETNTLVTRTFTIPHIQDTKGGGRKITGTRDTYEHVANYAQRRVRAAILEVIPYDVVEAAVEQVKKTIAKGNGETLIDRIRKFVLAFKEIGVSQEMLEKRMGHAVDLTTTEELVELHGIFTAIKDKTAKRQDFFELSDDEQKDDDKANALRSKLEGSST